MSEREGVAYAITLDTSQLEASSRKASGEFARMGDDAAKAGKRIDMAFNRAGGKSLAKLTMESLGDSVGKSGKEMEQAFARIDRESAAAFDGMSDKARLLAKDIQEDTAYLKRIESMQEALNDTYEQGGMSLDRYITSQARLSVLHEQVEASIQNTEKALRAETASIDIAEDSITAMQAKVSLLTVEYMRLSQAQREGTDGKALLKNLTEVQAKLQQATASMSQYARSTGAKFDGLNWSVQQIARELPVLAMSPQTFFLAISNNLPMFTDEVAKARKEYQLLTEAGKSATPVWKRVLSSMFSWQTALVAGISLLVAYGDEITDWIGSLFSADKALSDTFQSLEAWQTQVGESSGSVIAALERLSQGWTALGDDMQAKEQYLLDNRDAIDGLGVAIGDVNEAERLFVSGKDDFVLSIVERAKAAATMELAAEKFKEAVKKMQEADAMPDTVNQFVQTSSLGGGYYIEAPNSRKYKKRQQANDMFKEASELVSKYAQFSEEERKILEQIGIQSVDTMVAGSVEAIEAAIALKQEALKKVTDRADYDKIQAEINALQADLRVITGDPKAAQEAARQREQAEKQAADAELDLQRRKTQDKIDLLELEKQAELAAINGRIAAARSKEEKDALERLKTAREADYDWQIKEEKNVQLQQEQDELQALLDDYATYAQALQTVNDEYDRQLKLMRNADGTLKEGVEQGNIDELERQRQQAIDQISVEFASREAAFTQWSNSLQGKTLQQLQSMLAQSEAALAGADMGDTDPETVARLRAEVVTLRKRLEEMQDDTDSGKASWADLQQVLSDSISTFEQIGEAIGGTAGSVINSFGQIAGAAVSMANGIQAIGEAATAAEKASAILAVISAAIKVVTFITDGLRESKEATEAAALATREYEESLEALARTRAVEQHTNIFGTDTLSEIADQKAQADKLIQELTGDATGMKLSDEDIWDFASGMSGWANFSAKAHKLMKELKSGNVAMVSDMRSGWQKFWGTGNDNVFTLTADQMMTNGEFDGEKLREWYEAYGDGLFEENKAVIQTMLDQWDEYQTALQSVADNISAMMGDVANTVAEQLVDGFIETGDAVIDVEKAVGDLARSFAIAAVKKQLLDNVFNDELEARVTDLIVDGDTAEALQAITSALDGANLEGIAEVLQGLDQYFDRSDAEGGSSDRTASQKGIAAASQDSVDELNARATTIQNSIMNGVAELNRVGNLALERLAGIEANTAETNAKLDTLLLRYRGVQNAVTNLQAKGIKVAV